MRSEKSELGALPLVPHHSHMGFPIWFAKSQLGIYIPPNTGEQYPTADANYCELLAASSPSPWPALQPAATGLSAIKTQTTRGMKMTSINQPFFECEGGGGRTRNPCATTRGRMQTSKSTTTLQKANFMPSRWQFAGLAYLDRSSGFEPSQFEANSLELHLPPRLCFFCGLPLCNRPSKGVVIWPNWGSPHQTPSVGSAVRWT